MKERGYLLSIASNNATIFVKKILKHLNILHYFKYVMGSCDVDEIKPSPKMINKILKATTIIALMSSMVYAKDVKPKDTTKTPKNWWHLLK